VTAIQTLPKQRFIVAAQSVTAENILAQLDEVLNKAGTRVLGSQHQDPSITDIALTPVMHGCDLLHALPLTPSSAQVQKCVALLCAVSWYTPTTGQTLTALHKLIGKLVQSDWNCNEVRLLLCGWSGRY